MFQELPVWWDMDVIVPWRVIYEAQYFDIEGFSVEIHFDLKLGFERIQPEKITFQINSKKKKLTKLSRSQQIRPTKTSLQNVGTAIELEMIDYPQQMIRIQWEISPNL